jgi:hypothetical protein
MTNNQNQTKAEKEIPQTIEIGVYYYINEDGEPVFDEEEMQRELEEKIKNLKGQ